MCRKKLPAPNQNVLVMTEYGTITDGHRDGDTRMDMWWCAMGDRCWSIDEGVVVAWRPMPKHKRWYKKYFEEEQ